MTIYYVSSKKLVDNKLSPKVPLGLKGEDTVTPRISFSPTIRQCLLAMSGDELNKNVYFVYATDSSKIVMKVPTDKEVPDVSETKEVWSLEGTSVWFIGEIEPTKSDDYIDVTDSDGKVTTRKYLSYKWISASQPGVEHEFLQYLGIPYKPGGRYPSEGLSCYGFVRYLYADKYDINLPIELQWSDETGIPESFFGEIGLHVVDTPNVGDIIAFESFDHSDKPIGIIHLGVYAGNGLVIHENWRRGSCVNEVLLPKAKVHAYYRYSKTKMDTLTYTQIGVKNIQELSSWMATNVKYGFVDKYGGIVTNVSSDSSFENYILQSPEELLQNKVGVCWDQVEFERQFFIDKKIPHKTYYIEQRLKTSEIITHTFLVYTSSAGLFWFENSYEKVRGIHGPYETIEKIIEQVHKRMSMDNPDNGFEVYEYVKPLYGISADEFMTFCRDEKRLAMSELPQTKNVQGISKTAKSTSDTTPKQLVKITDVNRFLKYEKDKILLLADKLEISIPKFYVDSKLCTLGNKITTLGVFHMKFNDKYESNFMFTNMVDLTPSDVDTSSSEEFIICHFTKGDVVIPNSTVIKTTSVMYKIFNAFIQHGKIPSFISYEDADSILDTTQDANGVTLPVGHEIIEFMIAHMFRDQQNPKTFYRHTNQTKPPVVIGLQNAVYSPQSTSSKLLGAYMFDAINGALIDDDPVSDPVEKILTT